MKSVATQDGKKKVNKRQSTARAESTAGRRRAPGTNSKHIGDLADLDFMLQAASRGFPITKPFGDNEHYDVMVDARSRIWRVQVRSTSRHHCRGYAKIWYINSVRALQGRLVFDLYPFGCRRDGRRRFEKYRQAWHLLSPGCRPKLAPSLEQVAASTILSRPAGGSKGLIP